METLRSDPSDLSRRAALVRLGGAGLGLALAGRAFATFAQEASPAPTAIPAVIQQWADAWNSSDPATNVAALYTSDGVYEDVPTLTKSANGDVKGFLAGFTKGVSGTKVTLTHVYATADWAVAEYDFSGTDQGFIPGGEGKSFDVRIATVFELSGDKITRSSDYYDVVTILGQLGLMPAGGATPPATPSA